MKIVKYQPLMMVYDDNIEAYVFESMPDSTKDTNIAIFDTIQEADFYVQKSQCKYPLTITKLYL